MATKIVKKGAGRPAALAKQNKHAQRTPLPSKAVKKRTPAELAAETAGARAEVKEGMAKERAPKPKATGLPGESKAREFIAFAEAHGWNGDLEEVDPTHLRANIKKNDGRYEETIVATWLNGRVPDTSAGGVVYHCNGRTIMMRNVSAARQHIDGTKKQDREAKPRIARRVNVVNGVAVEREARTDNEYGPDLGTVDGMYRLLNSRGQAKYFKALGIGYRTHDSKCEGCDVFGCRETRPGAWNGPKVEPKVKKIIKRKAS